MYVLYENDNIKVISDGNRIIQELEPVRRYVADKQRVAFIGVQKERCNTAISSLS